MTTNKPSISRRPYAIGNVVMAPATFVNGAIGETADLLTRDGRLHPGQGLISTVAALTLAVLSLLGVIAFHFPAYLTTPELRHQYSVDALRQALFVALLIAGGLALGNLVRGAWRRPNLVAFMLVIMAVALGGSRAPVGDFQDHTPYIGLDWFILDLLGSTVIFVVIEKLFPLYRTQSVFRGESQTDLSEDGVTVYS